MFIANTWRTLGRISEPQGCHYTVFLTSATFPSHPKTHDCSANKEHASSGDTETDRAARKKPRTAKCLRTSGFAWCDTLDSSPAAAAVQGSQTLGLTGL